MKFLPAVSFACGLIVSSVPTVGQTKAEPEIKWDKMDLGPFFSGTFKLKDTASIKGILIKVGTAEDPAAVCFDTELLRMHAGWTGSFVKFPRGRGGLEGNLSTDGAAKFWTTLTPGWAKGETASDPRPKQQGPLPREWGHYRGLYLNGDRIILSYALGETSVLEMPGYESKAGAKVFTRTLHLGRTNSAQTLIVCDMGSTTGSVVPTTRPSGGGPTGPAEGRVAILTNQNKDKPEASVDTVVGVIGAPAGASFEIDAASQLRLKLPMLANPSTFQVILWSGTKKEFPDFAAVLKPAGALPNLAALCNGGPARWGSPLETAGKLGEGDEPYVADEIPLPDDNPFRSWLRPGGHDFFADGTAALVNLSGDVWLVSGLDEKLERVTWKRFAAGLFQPLGCKVVDGKIYVLGRDQITRLHDLNGDGEADFYENFNNDCVVTDNYHEFALDLQTDLDGQFYYAKGAPWPPNVISPHQGCVLQVSKDGRKLEVFATGLRAPNGLGMGPRGELTVSDNQGHWVPANRLNLVKKGGFYGMTPAAHREPPPTDYDRPLCWIPMQIDNSPGGEVWVPAGSKWGPFGGRMLHLSYGKCSLFGVMHEEVDGEVQGGLVRFPIRFASGIMRGRFNPKDGQLYLSGLNVWQSSAVRDGCFYRVRYTGRTATFPVQLQALQGGVRLQFTAPLDEKSATDPENYSVEQWNYAWTGNYGSPDLKVSAPKQKGRDLLLLDRLSLSADKKTLTIVLPEIQPAMQMKIKYKITAADGRILDHEIHNTIHRLAPSKLAAE